MVMIRWFGSLFAVIALCVLTTLGQHKHELPQSIYEMLRNGNFEEAKVELLKWHEGGNYEATRIIGQMHVNGDGFEENLTKGREYLTHASTNGNQEATFVLASSYYEEDVKTYAQLQHKAALQGHLIAAQQIGLAYFEGEGIKQCDESAYFWLFSITLRTPIASETFTEPLEVLNKRMNETDKEDAMIMAWNLVYRDLKQGLYQEKFDRHNPPEYGRIKKGNYKIVDGAICINPPDKVPKE